KRTRTSPFSEGLPTPPSYNSINSASSTPGVSESISLMITLVAVVGMVRGVPGVLRKTLPVGVPAETSRGKLVATNDVNKAQMASRTNQCLEGRNKRRGAARFIFRDMTFPFDY